jgi:hypothetical protein
MSPLPAHFTRFLTAVHRRLVLLRLLERIGITILIASGIALLAALALLWHARPAMGAVEACLAAGLIGGIVWGLARRPGPLAAAIEADKQLHLDDLLSSAWIMGRSEMNRGPWLAAVLAEAEARCQRASASALTLRRRGARGWGGIVLAAALVLTLASFGPAPVARQSADPGRSLQATTLELSGHTDHPLFDISTDAQHRPILLPDPDDPNASTLGQNTAPPPPAGKSNSSDAADVGDHASAGASDEGHGAGSARTQTPADKSASAQAQSAGTDAHSEHTTGQAAAGAGTPGVAGSGNDATVAGATAGTAPGASEAPPWKSAAWPADVARARQALDAGHVPAAYRDLVRNYFTPQDSQPQ